jgi:hypothetical protein
MDVYMHIYIRIYVYCQIILLHVNVNLARVHVSRFSFSCLCQHNYTDFIITIRIIIDACRLKAETIYSVEFRLLKINEIWDGKIIALLLFSQHRLYFQNFFVNGLNKYKARVMWQSYGIRPKLYHIIPYHIQHHVSLHTVSIPKPKDLLSPNTVQFN